MKYVGIDLGTTYSCISVVDDKEHSKPTVVDVKGKNITPSVVYFPPDASKEPIVGDSAKKRLISDPEATIALVKRSMTVDASGNFPKTWDIPGRQVYTPPEVSAIILKALYDAYLATGDGEHKVVVTCPANYSAEQRQLVSNAAKAAGIDVSEGKFYVINEPTAAAISYVMENDAVSGNIIIFDLGGGTLDVTALHYDKSGVLPKVTVVDSVGLPKTGGADWDLKVQEEIIRQLQDSGVTDITDRMKASALYESEKAKIDLTPGDLEDYVISIVNEQLEFNYTQERFDADTRHLLDQSLDVMQQVIDEFDSLRQRHEGVGPGFDGIVLVGGSCHMPQVMKGVKERFGNVVNGKIWVSDPSQAISRGAAYFAMLADKAPPVPAETVPGVPAPPSGSTKVSEIFTDIMKGTIGTDVAGPNNTTLCYNMVYDKDPIPFCKDFEFYLSGRTDRVRNIVFKNKCKRPEGTDPVHTVPVDGCEEIGSFDVQLPTYGERGDLVKVRVDITIGGLMTCTAWCNGATSTCTLSLKGEAGSEVKIN